jgi:hypothetical protein
MNYENRRYLIIPTSITGSINFNEVHETSSETLRLSVDGAKTFVKYDVIIVNEPIINNGYNIETNEEIQSITPAGIYGRPSIYNPEYPELTHSEIFEVLSGEEWTTPMEEEMYSSGSME